MLRICLGILLLIILGSLTACQDQEPTRIFLDHQITKYRPGWTPGRLREFYPRGEYAPQLRGGDYRQDGLSFRIGLYDQNRNGRYDETGTDILFLAPYGADSVALFPEATAAYLQAENVLGIRDLRFRIDSIAPDGSWLTILPEPDSLARPLVYLPYQLPNLKVKMLGGDSTYLQAFLRPNKYLYVEVWSSWHQYSFEASPLLKNTRDTYKDRLEVLSLIYNEVDYERVYRNNRRYDIDWPQAIYDGEVGSAIKHLGWVPYGALYAPDGKLIKSGLRPWELGAFLEKLL
jgi:hypothetical protein